MLDVSVIIVNYNTLFLLKNCIQSIYEHTTGISFEIIVSDNGSIDGSIEMLKTAFPEVIIIENKKNIGFGAANNRGLDVARGKYIFYLNSDTVLLNNAIKIFFNYWEFSEDKSNIGALGCNLLDANGLISRSFADFCRPVPLIKSLLWQNVCSLVDVFRRFFHIIKKKVGTNISISYFAGPVEFICGADLFILNTVYARFDERFFMYSEEADLQYQLFVLGLSRILIDGPKIIHFGQKSESSYPVDFCTLYTNSNILMNISNILFVKKMNVSFIYIVCAKALLLGLLLNPYYFNSTKKYLGKVLKI